MVYDGIEYEDKINGWIAVKNVSNYNSHIRIPPEIGNTPVIAIADHVFADNKHLKVIAIPMTVTEIGNYAFAGCENLETVKEIVCKLNSNYRGLKLRKEAFQGCKKLKELLLSSWITLSGEGIFKWCHNLEVIGVDGKNKVYGSIPESCFQACLSLPHLTIEKPTCVVHHDALDWTSSMKEITFKSHTVTCDDEDTWDTLRGKKIRCYENCNLVELSYDGVGIEIMAAE